MTRKQALTKLLERAEAGDRPAFIDGFAARAFPPESEGGYCTCHDAVEAYRGSLDAAKALHDAALPGRVYIIYNLAPGLAHVFPSHDNGDREAFTGLSDCPARAWLIAILKALIAQEPDQ